jgi:hypothetical protein
VIKVTNISGGQFVCTLASGETLRLDNNASVIIDEKDLTSGMSNAERLHKLLIEKVSETIRKTTTKKSAKSDNKKEEKTNG